MCVPLGMCIVFVAPSASFTFRVVSSSLRFGMTTAGGLDRMLAQGAPLSLHKEMVNGTVYALSHRRH